ncbi:SUMF1/EgtB/PvdO family nonheme iron enzyme [Aestuariirhabdus sp. Z084]|uniref:selenoneine synthase SenA n=1 Tax=Aestuariirhabdus haliotis TaxID=2918751 RepID=UPI00201B364B|nr:selenoneine synthase SenA [Aestuariirhabdus haliotis]MCL6414026.1 SUMF1/EgtB/PvdO family nonheme iron enzyme [Aestuariirhabdus haliotis]MCL6417959.1 SUMF1/EgtB/PvdO family nonheme iron enzyme [Aestuariirhabdus haliotis]
MVRLNAQKIARQAVDAHQRTLALIDGLSPEQMMGPRLATVNPLRWEIGHVAYFYEYWVLRQHLKQPPIREDADQLYDSINIAHDDRWDLPLPSVADTRAYMEQVLEQILQALNSGDDPRRDYLAQYAVFHQDMHNEAYTYTRQTLGYPAPSLTSGVASSAELFAQTPSTQATSPAGGDVHIPGGRFMLGASRNEAFVFDNEKWAHEIDIAPFAIARTAVSNGDYLEFVEAGGYLQSNYWDEAGWQWLQQSGLSHPCYWRLDASGWQLRQFDQWHPLPLECALIHVCWHEAQAYCRWADRRLPSEAEWEVAASAEPDTRSHASNLVLPNRKRYLPWSHQPASEDDLTPANLDGFALGALDVSAHGAGDSALGCRQMIGNVWEWTATPFGPFPGFTPDMYQDYSQPLFGKTMVLRGGAWSTRARMIRNTWRTYYGPERNDVFAGFRTCAL